MKKVWVETLGCKVNLYESELIKNNFEKIGYELSDNTFDADVIVINTCSVTNQSDAKSRKVIRRMKRENPNAVIAVCGCSAQNHQDELLDLGVNVLIGNKGKSEIHNLVEDFISSNKTYNSFDKLINVPFEDMFIDNYKDRTRAFVKIQDGCNNYCAYCIIPYLRGTIRNKDFDTAVKEINSLVDNGFKEIVLTGIHTGSYPRLVELIHTVSENPKLERIRISSIEITELDDEFFEEFKNNKKICSHLHVPVQSACDNTLKFMNRKYDMDFYFKQLEKIRSIREDVNITTDLIVGFPTETEEDFIESLENAKKCNFGKIHVFPFSLRSGTRAESFKNLVSDKQKDDRTHKMIELSNELENRYYMSFIGKNVSVLVEEEHDGYSVGHTDNYIKVTLNGVYKHNESVNAVIKRVDKLNVYGEVVD